MPSFLQFYYLCHINPEKIMELLSYFYHPDHLGSSSWITDNNGYTIQYLHYLPYGEDWVDERNSSWFTPYTFSAKEKDVETGYGYFGARYYDSGLSIWLSVDPMSDKYPSLSPYNYCANNPVILVDPDGLIPWPLLPSYKNFGRTHSNNWHEIRQKSNGGFRLHYGVDMNHTGGGNTDYNAPIVATHDGYITKIVKNDKNGGGVRITITSKDGTVSTSYMHLSGITDGLEVGQAVLEGQQIGTMGGSGYGKTNAYTSHLHYELFINGKNENPIGEDGKPIDPQKLLKSSEILSRKSAEPQLKTNTKSFWTRVKESLLNSDISGPHM